MFGDGANIDVCLDRIRNSKSPIKLIFSLIKENEDGLINRLLTRSIQISDITSANYIYKALILGKVYRCNRFIERVADGTYEDMLGSMDLDNKVDLVEDLIIKDKYLSSSSDAIEGIRVLKNEILNELDEKEKMLIKMKS